jgi:hypothetical protein
MGEDFPPTKILLGHLIEGEGAQQRLVYILGPPMTECNPHTKESMPKTEYFWCPKSLQGISLREKGQNINKGTN